MPSAERLLLVQELFAKEEFVELSDLCNRLNVSKSSALRDLIELARREVLRRVHAGAISLQARDEVLDYARLSITCHHENLQIGKAAAELIEEDPAVIFAGGSTFVTLRPDGGEPTLTLSWKSRSTSLTALYPRRISTAAKKTRPIQLRMPAPRTSGRTHTFPAE